MRQTGLAGSAVGQTRHSLTRWTVWGRARSLLVARVAEGAGLAFPGLRDTPPFPVSPWLSHSRLPNVWRPHAGGEPAWHGPSLAVIPACKIPLRGEEGGREWGSLIASLTQWT